MQNKHVFKLLLILFLVLGLGLSSASADLVTLSVDGGAKGSIK